MIPNMFFSITHSKLTEIQRGVIRKYWIANLSVTGVFVVVVICTVFIPSTSLWPSNIVQIIEIVYTLGFYGFVLFDFKDENPVVQRKLWKFFLTYVFFAMTSIVCCVFRGTGFTYISENVAMHHVLETVLLVTFIRSLSKIHLEERGGKITS